MKVIAINTSPEKDYGLIAMLLDPFLDGMRESGADVELYYSRDLLIFPCCGNLNCTVRTPGQCMAYDDMRWLRPKIGQADVLVLASPLYFDGRTGAAGVTGPMKRLQERLTMFRDLDDTPYEHAVHTTREAVNLRKVVVISGCGFWEIDDFYPVITHLKAFCYNSLPELAGCITGGHRVTVRETPVHVSSMELMMIARTAGRELAEGYQIVLAKQSAACDGGAETALPAGPEMVARHQREWGSEILLDWGIR